MRVLPAILLAASLCAGSVSLAADQADPAKPSLGDLMTLLQLRHFKLWYAQRMENWPLADYELRQMRDVVTRTAKLYPEAASVAQAVKLNGDSGPIIDEIGSALDEKNGKRFEAAFGRLTQACNACHREAGVGFIAVQVPKRSPFSNQSFRPGAP